MRNSIDLTALLPEVEQPRLGLDIRLNQFALVAAICGALGFFALCGFHVMDFFVRPATGSVLDYRPARVVGHVGRLITPAEAKVKFLASYPAWREVAR